MLYESDIGYKDQFTVGSIYKDAMRANQFRLLGLESINPRGLLQHSLKDHPPKDVVLSYYSAILYIWDSIERVWYGANDPSADQSVLLNGTLKAVSNKVAT